MSGADAPGKDEFDSELDATGLRPPHAADDTGTWGWTPGRIAAALLLTGVIVFWIWAFSPLAPRGHPDELSDPTFPEAAEPLCAAAVERIEDEVPPAKEATGPSERADQIDASTAILEELLVELHAIAPDPTTEDGDIVARWLADWETFVGDRYRYAETFRAGIDDRFVVTTSPDGGQITDPIDAFAVANRMPSCASPQDV